MRINSVLIATVIQLFCMALLADAQIVYTNVNASTSGTYNLDLNNDGSIDFIFRGSSIIINCGRTGWASKVSLTIAPANTNNEVITDGAGYAIALLNGSPFISGSQWSNTSQVLYDNGNTCNSLNTGHWTASNTDQYLGLRFTKNNNIYYGWARVTWDLVLRDYAYNSAAGDPIFAGQGASTVFPQTAPAIQWQKSLGGNFADIGNCIRQTSDGGFIIAGQASSTDGDVTGNHGYYDYWIVKLNSYGTIQWQKSLGGSSADAANSIMQAADGGYIVAGIAYSSDGDVSGNHGVNDGWIVKLNSSGTIEWQKCLGGSADEGFQSIIQTADGGYIAAGYTYSNDGDVSGNHGSWDGWIVKLNSTGTIEWQKCLGGSGHDDIHSIIQTADGSYIAAGNSDSNDGDISGNHGQQDLVIVKLNSTGTIVSQKTMGGSLDDFAFSIQQTTDGGFIVAGSTGSNNGDVSGNHGGEDCWLIKLSNIGTIEWKKVLGSSGVPDRFSSVWQTTDGGYIAGGWSASNDGDVSGNHGGLGDYWVVKLNSTGGLQWQKCLGGSQLELAFSIQQTTDGGYIVAGYAESNDGDVNGNHGGWDCWIVKLGADIVVPLRLLSFTGIFKNNATKLNWQTADEINTNHFIVERSANAINFSAIGKVNVQTSPSLTNSYQYTDNAALPGTNFYRLKMEDKDSSFTYSKVIRISHNSGNEIIIAPNPVADQTSISFTLQQKQKILISIYDMSGRLVKILANAELQAGTHELTWNVKDEKGIAVSAGIYFLKLQTSNYSETRKLIVEK